MNLIKDASQCFNSINESLGKYLLHFCRSLGSARNDQLIIIEIMMGRLTYALNLIPFMYIMILQSPLTRYFLAVSSISVRIENLCKWLKAYTNFIPNPYQFHPIFPFQFQKRIFYHIMLQFIYPWFSFDSNSKFHWRCLPDNLKFHPISVPVLILFFPDPTQKWLVSATGNVWSTTV